MLVSKYPELELVGFEIKILTLYDKILANLPRSVYTRTPPLPRSVKRVSTSLLQRRRIQDIETFCRGSFLHHHILDATMSTDLVGGGSRSRDELGGPQKRRDISNCEFLVEDGRRMDFDSAGESLWVLYYGVCCHLILTTRSDSLVGGLGGDWDH